MICSEYLWQEQTDPAVGIFMQIGAISLWLKRQLTEKNASNFRSSLCVSEASTQCWTDILLTFIFHQRGTHSLLLLESTNYPNWRQMLLERLKQSLHEALHTPSTERGQCQHPACPTHARIKGTGTKTEWAQPGNIHPVTHRSAQGREHRQNGSCCLLHCLLVGLKALPPLWSEPE